MGIFDKKKNKEKALKTRESTLSKRERLAPRLADNPALSIHNTELDFRNEVYDEAEIASSIEMGFLAQSLNAQRELIAPEKHPDFDGETCVSCGDDMPEERLKMGRVRCVYCQEALEKRNKLMGK